MRLPSKPSKLIRVALKDLSAAEKAGMNVNMGCWYDKNKEGGCTVCLAGAVMARHFELDKDEGVAPSTLWSRNLINSQTYDKLRALDFFRSGQIENALEQLGLGMSFQDKRRERLYSSMGHRYMPDYDENPQAFHKALGKLADDLEAVGL